LSLFLCRSGAVGTMATPPPALRNAAMIRARRATKGEEEVALMRRL
jgi:hypothetical protein